jgi:hypothetical protein
MIAAEIRRLQYLNDLIGQTLEVIQQRSFGIGASPYAQFGVGALPYASPLNMGASPYAPQFGVGPQVHGGLMGWGTPAFGHYGLQPQSFFTPYLGTAQTAYGPGAFPGTTFNGGVAAPWTHMPFDRSGVGTGAIS